MSNQAPVKAIERRGLCRHRVTLDIHWHGRNGRAVGTISDLNGKGCFILAGESVCDGDTVHVFIPINEGMKAQFTGVVTNHEDDIGFAVRFEELEEGQRIVLDDLIKEIADA